MDLNTKEIFKKNSLEIFNQLNISIEMSDDDFQIIQDKIDAIEIPEIKKFVYLFIANKFFLLEKYYFSNVAYQKTTMSIMNFFELMSFLDTCVFTGELVVRKKIIRYSVERILKEKRLNLINEFILKMKSIRVEAEVIKRLQGSFVLCSGDSSYIENEDIDLLEFTQGQLDSFLGKIDFWRNDRKILKAIIGIDKNQFQALSPELKDKIKFYGLNYYHKTLIADIGSFDWKSYIDFLLVTGRSVGYDEVNRIIFDFNINVDQVKLLDLKSLSFENEKMHEVEKVMGDIGLSEEFSKSINIIDQNLSEISISDVDFKISQSLDDETQTFIQSISKAEPTAALEYIKFLDATKTNELISDLEKQIFGFSTTDPDEMIKEQINKAYIVIKICIYASEFARALKMMDFVISKFPLAKRELASFIRLKKELKSKWKKD